jgi:hypothetical protein
MSANMTHSTKILAVNHKQLSNDIIDPLFLNGTYGSAVSRQSHSGQSIQIHVFEQGFVTSEKPIFGILFLHKNGTVHVTFPLALITLWACAYPWDALATYFHHTCVPGARRGRPPILWAGGLRILFQQETLERKRDSRSPKLYADCGLNVPLLDASRCHVWHSTQSIAGTKYCIRVPDHSCRFKCQCYSYYQF